MDQGTLKLRLLYAPLRGVFYWVQPPQSHSSLLGEEAGSPVNAGSGKAYHVIQVDGKKYKRSRLAFLYMEGRWPTPCVDHIDGNSLNDRWDNLREASIIQNCQNRGKWKDNGLPLGVRRLNSGNFSARITVNKRQISLGSFGSEEAAAQAYEKAREKYFG